MTIGIGALCESGDCVILGCDTRASYEAEHHLNPNDWTSKFYDLPHNCFAIVAGTLAQCHDVCLHLTAAFKNLKEPFELDAARNAINEGRFSKYRQKAEDRILAKFGLSLADWQRLPHNAAVYRGGTNIFRNLSINVGIIVAGFRNKNPADNVPGSTHAILFRAVGKGALDSENNYTVIGSGNKEAMRVLDRRGQNSHRSWQRTAIDVIAALKASRRANTRSVGSPDDLILIFQNEIKRLPVGATFVKTLLGRTKTAKISQYNSFDPTTNELLSSILYDQPKALI